MRYIMHTSGLLVQLKNTVYKELFNLLDEGTDPVDVPAQVQKEPVTFIRLAQEKWEGKLRQAINKLCVDFRVPLSRQVCSVWNFIFTRTQLFNACMHFAEADVGEGIVKEEMEFAWSGLPW